MACLISLEVQPMNRLLPVMRLHYQLKERVEGSKAHQQPVNRYEKRPRQKMVLLPFHACEHICIDVEKVPKDQAELSQIQGRAKEQLVIDIQHRIPHLEEEP